MGGIEKLGGGIIIPQTNIDMQELEEAKKKKKKMGRISRAAGKRFENDVRKDLEAKGWTVCKWTNTVEFEEGEGKLIQAKSKYNPFLGRVISEGAGMPDFIAFRLCGPYNNFYEITGVESKMAKYLDAKEKQICTWLLDNKIFHEILVAYPEYEGKKKKIVYKKFEP